MFSGRFLYPLITTLSLGVLSAEPLPPFPENRVRDFYRGQAQNMLLQPKPWPQSLEQFPGLDGGAWGHWGQNPESDNEDKRLNEVDFGGLLMQITTFDRGLAMKGVNVRVGEHCATFDPERLTFVTAWKGDFMTWASRRYGITSGVKPGGERVLDLSKATWNLPEDLLTRYLGFYRSGDRVVFVYQIGEATVYSSLEEQEGRVTLVQGVEGELPEGIQLETGLPIQDDLKSLLSLVRPGAARALWKDQSVVTQGELGSGSGAFVMDTLTVPYRDENPFKTPMRIGGVDILSESQVAVCTLMGDVWIVDGVDEDLEELTWKRFASGLHQPLGLVVSEGAIYVIGRDQLTLLHDRNGDGEADFYECVTNDFPTSRGNNFALTLHRDAEGAFYWFTRSNQFGMTRWEPGSEPESIATGLRGCNGSGVSPDGSIVFAMPQEGRWTPASAIFEVGEGSYHGHFGPKEEYGPHGYDLPLCFLPRGVENSSGDALFLPEDSRLGPLSGKILGSSFGYCQHYVILREEVEEKGVQGGVLPLPGEFLSGAHRLRFNKHDGAIYVVGTDGWQSYAQENGSLQRLRYQGNALKLPRAVETYENGLLLRYDVAIDEESLSEDRVFAQQWNYLYSEAYGSPEYSVKNPGVQGHDLVEVSSVHRLEDGKSVFVEIPQLHPVMQFHLFYEMKTHEGESVETDLYYSIFHQREAFTGFPGYNVHAKEPWNDFPRPEESPLDPRLAAQERKGKIVADEDGLSAIAKLKVQAVPGLQFEPKQLTVKAGARVVLKFTNVDESMPHNWVLVTEESMEAVGEGSMKLATSPEGLAQHYVIQDSGVLAMTPVLQAGASYMVYFTAPEEAGEYPYLCTFPGHWQVTRGVLVVEP